MIIYSLGTVTFDDSVESGLYIEEEHKWLPLGQNIRYALAGNPVIMENPRSGKPLTIVAQEDKGWITKAHLLALKDLASSIGTYNLFLKNDLGVNETRQVKFKRNPYPLDMNPVDYAENYYVGTISLIQID
jgi:hypothetical protein